MIKGFLCSRTHFKNNGPQRLNDHDLRRTMQALALRPQEKRVGLYFDERLNRQTAKDFSGLSY